MSRIVIATSNQAKVARVRKLTRHLDVEILALNDCGLGVVDIPEGSNVSDNAKAKALAYRPLTDMPIIANDTAFHIEDESFESAHVKRNAFAGRDEELMTREQKTETFLSFYRGIAARHGGRVSAYWEDVYALSIQNGDVYSECSRRDVVLTDQIHGSVDPAAPIRCLYLVKATGKYVVDQTEIEELQELAPVQCALEALIRHIQKI